MKPEHERRTGCTIGWNEEILMTLSDLESRTAVAIHVSVREMYWAVGRSISRNLFTHIRHPSSITHESSNLWEHLRRILQWFRVHSCPTNRRLP